MKKLFITLVALSSMSLVAYVSNTGAGRGATNVAMSRTITGADAPFNFNEYVNQLIPTGIKLSDGCIHIPTMAAACRNIFVPSKSKVTSGTYKGWYLTEDNCGDQIACPSEKLIDEYIAKFGSGYTEGSSTIERL